MAELSTTDPQAPAPSTPTQAYSFAEGLGLSTPQERKERGAKIEAARGELSESAKRIGTMQETLAGDTERGGADVARLGQERFNVAQGMRPEVPQIPTPPSAAMRPFLAPGDDMLGKFSTLLSGIGLMGLQMQGLKGGGYAIAATAGLKGMMQGWQEGDAERVKRNYLEWNANQEKLLAEHALQRQTYHDILNDYDRAIQDRLADIQVRASSTGYRVLAEKARAGDIEGVLKSLEGDRDHDQAALGLQVQMAKWNAQQAKDEKEFQRKERADAERARHARATEATAAERLTLSKGANTNLLKLEKEDLGLSQKLGQMDTLLDAVGRLDAKGVIPSGPTGAEKAMAKGKMQLAFGDKEMADDIETVKRMGTALLIGSEIAAGLSPGIARLKVVGEAEAAGADAIPMSFWKSWKDRQSKALREQQGLVRRHLNATSRAAGGQADAEPREIVVQPGELD